MAISVWLEVAFSIDLSVNMCIEYAIWSIEYLRCVWSDWSLESIFLFNWAPKHLHTKNSQITSRVFLIIASHILQLTISTDREYIWRWLITYSSIISWNSWEIWYRLCESSRLWVAWEIRRSEPEREIEIFVSVIASGRSNPVIMWNSFLFFWITSSLAMTETYTCYTERDMSVLIHIDIFWESYIFSFMEDNTPRMRISLEELYLNICDLTIFAEHIPIRYDDSEPLVELSTLESVYLKIFISWRDISSKSVAGISRDDSEHIRERWVRQWVIWSWTRTNTLSEWYERDS